MVGKGFRTTISCSPKKQGDTSGGLVNQEKVRNKAVIKRKETQREPDGIGQNPENGSSGRKKLLPDIRYRETSKEFNFAAIVQYPTQ